MAKTEIKDGAHRLRKQNQEYTEDEIRLMKSQDKNYIKMHQQMEFKVINNFFLSFIQFESNSHVI